VNLSRQALGPRVDDSGSALQLVNQFCVCAVLISIMHGRQAALFSRAAAVGSQALVGQVARRMKGALQQMH
jgi:hypothetical protein